MVAGLAGIITGGAAWAALGIVGGIAAAVTGLMVALGAIEGAIEREVGRDDIILNLLLM